MCGFTPYWYTCIEKISKLMKGRRSGSPYTVGIKFGVSKKNNFYMKGMGIRSCRICITTHCVVSWLLEVVGKHGHSSARRGFVRWFCKGGWRNLGEEVGGRGVRGGFSGK